MFNFLKKKSVEELKVVDFPRGQYDAYWEIQTFAIPGGQVSEVRIYAHDHPGVELAKTTITGPDKDFVQKKINSFLNDEMAKHKRA